MPVGFALPILGWLSENSAKVIQQTFPRQPSIAKPEEVWEGEKMKNGPLTSILKEQNWMGDRGIFMGNWAQMKEVVC